MARAGRVWRWGLVAVAAGLAVAVAVHFWMMRVPADLDLSRDKTSQEHLYRVALAPEAEPLRQGPMQSLVVSVSTADGRPVEDATIGIDGGMPQHGHGLPTSPAVTAYLGGGRYRMEGIKFNMAGWWELKLSISAPPGDDRVTFNLRL
ncbi:MAG: FixH family protein [Mesorhizobium sp.]|jgi:hypothetical protein